MVKKILINFLLFFTFSSVANEKQDQIHNNIEQIFNIFNNFDLEVGSIFGIRPFSKTTNTKKNNILTTFWLSGMTFSVKHHKIPTSIVFCLKNSACNSLFYSIGSKFLMEEIYDCEINLEVSFSNYKINYQTIPGVCLKIILEKQFQTFSIGFFGELNLHLLQKNIDLKNEKNAKISRMNYFAVGIVISAKVLKIIERFN